MKLLKVVLLSITLVSPVAAILLKINPVIAGCNPFGCSQSSAAECNPFGCPNSPVGAACTPFGCPSSAQLQPQPTNNTAPTGSSQPRGGSPDGIASCVNKLLYKNAQVCTRTDVFGRCTETEIREVRSDISENVAVQACQNAS